jgi:hypothetical protein
LKLESFRETPLRLGMLVHEFKHGAEIADEVGISCIGTKRIAKGIELIRKK